MEVQIPPRWHYVGTFFALGHLFFALGCLLGAALESSALNAGTVGHQFNVSLVLWDLDWWCEKFFGGLLAHFVSLGTPLGLIFLVLGRLGTSFWVSWGLLGHSCGLSWPHSAQDCEKTSIFSICLADVGPKLGAKIKKNRCQERCFFQMRFWPWFLSIFHRFWIPKFNDFWIDFRP